MTLRVSHMNEDSSLRSTYTPVATLVLKPLKVI